MVQIDGIPFAVYEEADTIFSEFLSRKKRSRVAQWGTDRLTKTTNKCM